MLPTPTRRLAAVATVALGAALLPTATSAAAAQDPIPIGPNMYFTGFVNGKSAGAVVQVICPGPVGPNSTGHPVSGQTAEVRNILPPTNTQFGYTGSAGKQIDASFNSSSVAQAPIVFTAFYAPAAIPTTWTVPCGGTGAMTFVPLPTSPTAQSYTVTVTFENIGV